MRIVTLVENTAAREDLCPEHGLSLYIETKAAKILFDAGQSGCFADNAQKLGVDLGLVDIGILSHGHRDHSGGLPKFFSLNASAPVYLQKTALADYYGSQGDYIGLGEERDAVDRLRFVQTQQEIGEGLTLFSGSCVPEKEPIDTAGLTVERDGFRVPDSFLHEQYLLIEEEGKRILISGCSHRGILNIADHFQPDVLIGGFHFFKQMPDSPMVTEAAHRLLGYPCVYYTGHCTGTEQFAVMKKIMADRLHELSTGTVVTL